MEEDRALNAAEVEELATLADMWNRHKIREEDARISLDADNTRTLTFGPNVSKQAQAIEIDRYKSQTTAARTDMFAEAFSNFNMLMEGESSGFMNPGKGTSGWTVGQGIDIGQTSREEAVALGMPAQLIDIADKYKAWGVQGKKVPKTVQNMQVDTNTPEWTQFRKNIAARKVPVMEEIARTNPNLSTRAVVTLAQMDHWAGSIYAKSDEATKLNRSELSLSTSGEQTSPTEDLMNPIAQYLQSGNATDEGLVETISLIRDSYGDKRPLNSTTMERYKSFLTTGSA